MSIYSDSNEHYKKWVNNKLLGQWFNLDLDITEVNVAWYRFNASFFLQLSNLFWWWQILWEVSDKILMFTTIRTGLKGVCPYLTQLSANVDGSILVVMQS